MQIDDSYNRINKMWQIKLDGVLRTKMVWFGSMEFGSLTVGEGGDASIHPICIVHRIDERRNIDTNDIDHYIYTQRHEGDYIIPSEFDGDIVYSNTYMKGHTR
jgi:hypothetical protein